MHMLALDLAVLLVVVTSVKEHNGLLQRTNFSKWRLFCFIILPHFMSHWLPFPLVVLSLVQTINRHLAGMEGPSTKIIQNKAFGCVKERLGSR